MFLQFGVARIESHFSLSLKPAIKSNNLEDLYSKEELIDVVNMLSELDAKLNDGAGNYREQKDD